MLGIVWISKRVGVVLVVEDASDTVCCWLFLVFDLWFPHICWDMQVSRRLGCFHHAVVLSVTFKKMTLLLSFRMPCHTSVWKTCCTALLIHLDVVQTSLRRSQSLLCLKGCDTCCVCSGGIGPWIGLCWRSIHTPKKRWVWICSYSSFSLKRCSRLIHVIFFSQFGFRVPCWFRARDLYTSLRSIYVVIPLLYHRCNTLLGLIMWLPGQV